MTTQSRQEREIRAARAQFCAKRRAPSFLTRWLAWYYLRASIEDWESSGRSEIEGAQHHLVEAEKWRRGFRPPASFHEANGRIRAEIRAGRLRARGGGG